MTKVCRRTSLRAQRVKPRGYQSPKLDKSFLHSNSRVSIWYKQHEQMIHPALYQQFRLLLLI